MAVKTSLYLLALAVLALLVAATVSYAADSATYGYDSNGRIHTITYANGTVTTYTYDKAGNRQTVVTTCSGSGC